MDSFARGLKNAACLIEDGTLDALVKVSSTISFVCSVFYDQLGWLSSSIELLFDNL